MSETVPEISAPKTAGGDSPVIPLLLLGAGGYLAWFAIHYWRDQQTKWPSDPVKSVLQGHGLPQAMPAQSEQASIQQQIDTAHAGSSGGTGAAPGSGSVSGSAIAADALKYQGHKYVYGGSPGSNGQGGWDCSSFVNWVVGHDMKLAIPAYPRNATYQGLTHGPDVGSWIGWSGVQHVSRKNVAAGDLCAWGPNDHIGIAISNTEMISAMDPAQGTGKGSINGSNSLGVPFYLRLRETSLTQFNPGKGHGAYTHSMLESLWRMGGGSAGTANVAAAVAQAESSGNQAATSGNPDGGTNVGLWQLDTRGKGAGYSVTQLKNALTNARAAVKGSSNGRDWSAWATYASGAYRKFLT